MQLCSLVSVLNSLYFCFQSLEVWAHQHWVSVSAPEGWQGTACPCHKILRAVSQPWCNSGSEGKTRITAFEEFLLRMFGLLLKGSQICVCICTFHSASCFQEAEANDHLLLVLQMNSGEVLWAVKVTPKSGSVSPVMTEITSSWEASGTGVMSLWCSLVFYLA